MPLIDLSGLTLEPEEARASAEAVFERLFSKPELRQIHGVQTGIKMKTQIPFFGKFSPFLKKDPGGCATNTVSQTISTSEKYWDPELLSGRLGHCQGDITDSLFKMWRTAMKANPDIWSEIDNEMLAFLESRLEDVLYEDILLKSFLGDTAADNVSNGGNITDGLDADLLTPFDGFWKQILTGVAATTIYRYTITENASATKTAQLNLADDRAILAMRDLYNNADSRLFSTGNVAWQMTRTMHNNYKDYLEDKSLAFTLTQAEDGSNKDMYRGLPIIVREDWDRNIRTFLDQGDTFLDPHRIILSDINNIPIGTLDEESFSKLDVWYERKDKEHYIDTALTLDAKVLEEYAIAVAY